MSAQSREAADWLAPGSTVIVHSGAGMDSRYRETVIERLTAKQIVTSDGTRYRREDLGEIGPYRRGMGTLVDPGDPGVTRALLARDEEAAITALDMAALRWRNQGRYKHGDEREAAREALREALAAAQAAMAALDADA